MSSFSRSLRTPSSDSEIAGERQGVGTNAPALSSASMRIVNAMATFDGAASLAALPGLAQRGVDGSHCAPTDLNCGERGWGAAAPTRPSTVHERSKSGDVGRHRGSRSGLGTSRAPAPGEHADDRGAEARAHRARPPPRPTFADVAWVRRYAAGRAASSTGQSSRLIICHVRVQVPGGPRRSRESRCAAVAAAKSAARVSGSRRPCTAAAGGPSSRRDARAKCAPRRAGSACRTRPRGRTAPRRSTR